MPLLMSVEPSQFGKRVAADIADEWRSFGGAGEEALLQLLRSHYDLVSSRRKRLLLLLLQLLLYSGNGRG